MMEILREIRKSKLLFVSSLVVSLLAVIAYMWPIILCILLGFGLTVGGLIAGLCVKIHLELDRKTFSDDADSSNTLVPPHGTAHQILTKFLATRKSSANQLQPGVTEVGLDEAVGKFLDLVIRDCIIYLVRDMVTDEVLLKEMLRQDLWSALNNFGYRVSAIDKTSLLAHKAVDIVTRHFVNIRLSSGKNGRNSSTPFQLHPCLASCKAEMDHVRRIAGIFVGTLLPHSFSEHALSRDLLREILTCKVLSPAIDLICNPHYLNCKLSSWLNYRQQLMAETERNYKVAPTYERFMKIIEECQDIEKVKMLRYSIISELMHMAVIKEQQQKGTSLSKSTLSKQFGKQYDSRDIDRYINQLKKAKVSCARQLQFLGGVAYSCYADGNKIPPRKKSMPFSAVLATSAAREAFLKFLQRTNNDHLLRFCESVETMKQSKHRHQIACDVYRTYVTPRSSPLQIKFDKQLVNSMGKFINGHEGPEGFWKARDEILHLLEERFFPSFIISDIYHSYTKKQEIPTGQDALPTTTSALDTEAAHSDISVHAARAKESLLNVEDRIGVKSDLLKTLIKKPSTGDDDDVKRCLGEIHMELDRLRQQRSQLEFLVERTQTWLSKLGNWKAKIFDTNVITSEGGSHLVLFTIVVEPASTAAGSQSDETCSSWVITRYLQDFLALHRELSTLKSSVHSFHIPSKLTSYDVQMLDQCKKQLQEFINHILDASVLACSEPVYVFFSPCKELVKQIATPRDSQPTARPSLFSRFSSRQASLPSMPIQADDHLSVSVDDAAASEAVIQPLNRLMFEVFELKGIVNWFPRLLVSMVQAIYGKSISRQFRETVEWILSEPMLIYYVQLFTDAYWPDGNLATAFQPPTDNEKLQARRKAKSLLLRSTVATTNSLMMMTDEQARYGIIKVFEAFQDERLNKHLFYSLLELFMQEAFSSSGGSDEVSFQ